MMRNLSLRAKLLSLFIAMALLTAVVGTAAYVSMASVISKFERITKENMPSTIHLLQMRGYVRSVRIAATDLAVPGKTKDQVKDLFEKMADSWTKFDVEHTALMASHLDAQEQQMLQASEVVAQQVRDLSKSIAKLAEVGDAAAMASMQEIISGDFNRVGREYTSAIDPLLKLEEKEAATLSADAQATVDFGNWIVLGCTLASFAFASIVGFAFATSLANGYTALARQLGAEATAVTGTSEDISNSGNALSAATSEQAAAIQETVASIDEVNAMVGKNAQNAQRSLAVAKAGDAAAQSGKDDVAQMLLAINEISASNNEIMEQTAASNREFASIVNVIADIGNRTKVINDIVFQTKLLSFNASVEAARAGDQGKGFAVVAEEVGKLAQMSGDAAKEIAQLLQDSMQKVETTVATSKQRIERLIDLGRDKIEKGLATAHRCDKSLEDIVSRVQELSHMVDEIATASDEQAKGVEEITKAMGQMDQVTQQNAASAQNSAAVSKHLNEQSQSLIHLVKTLEATVHGADAASAVSTTTGKYAA